MLPVLVKDAITEFLNYLIIELNRSKNTQSGYAKDLHVFMKYLQSIHQESITLQELTPEMLSGYLRYLTRERQSKANTVRRHVTSVKSFCAFLVDCDYLTQNPAMALSRPRMPQKQPRHLHRCEVEKLFDIISENDSFTKLRDKTAFMFMYYSGVRVTELVNIKREDLDLTGGFIRIIKGKGRRFRKVPMHNQLKQQLEKYLLAAPELVNEYLFFNRQGRQISTDYIHHILVEYAQKAGINKRVTPHMLRHSFATHLYLEDVDISTLGKLLGHAGLRTTAVYTHADLKHMRAAVNKLNTSSKLEARVFRADGGKFAHSNID